MCGEHNFIEQIRICHFSVFSFQSVVEMRFALVLTCVLYSEIDVASEVKRKNTMDERMSGCEMLRVAMECAGNCKYGGG